MFGASFANRLSASPARSIMVNDNVGNRNWIERDGGNGDVFDYDQADQAIVAKLDIANPSGTAPGSPTIIYDANGNREWFTAG
jgi:hypothetical protein